MTILRRIASAKEQFEREDRKLVAIVMPEYMLHELASEIADTGFNREQSLDVPTLKSGEYTIMGVRILDSQSITVLLT